MGAHTQVRRRVMKPRVAGIDRRHAAVSACKAVRAPRRAGTGQDGDDATRVGEPRAPVSPPLPSPSVVKVRIEIPSAF
jgi:hypothetical protein